MMNMNKIKLFILSLMALAPRILLELTNATEGLDDDQVTSWFALDGKIITFILYVSP